MQAWWGLFANEWLKFRRRRRVWMGLGGIVVLVALITMAIHSPSANTREFWIHQDQSNIRATVAQLRTAHGATRTMDRAELLLTRYDVRELTGRPLPPMAPIVRAAAEWVRAESHGNRVANTYTPAIQAWQQSRFALAAHLPLEPSWEPPSGLVDVSQVFAGSWVALLALMAVLLSSDVLGMEWATHTWNRVWLEPPSRWRLILAKAALALAVATGTLALAAVLLYAAGALRFGPGTDWVTVETHYRVVSVYFAHYHRSFPLSEATALSDAAGVSLVASDVWAVLGSLLPVSAVVAVAALLGYAISQPTVATLLAAGFAAAPTLVLAGNGHPWLVWLPGSYLAMGQIAAGVGYMSFATSGDGVSLGLAVSAAWLALAWGAAGWHQRRREV